MENKKGHWKMDNGQGSMDDGQCTIGNEQQKMYNRHWTIDKGLL